MICNFCLSVAAHRIVVADPSLRYNHSLACCWDVKQPTNNKAWSELKKGGGGGGVWRWGVEGWLRVGGVGRKKRLSGRCRVCTCDGHGLPAQQWDAAGSPTVAKLPTQSPWITTGLCQCGICSCFCALQFENSGLFFVLCMAPCYCFYRQQCTVFHGRLPGIDSPPLIGS